MEKKCKVKGCEDEYAYKGYCNKHYLQIRRHGKTLERTMFDKNEIVLKDDYVEVLLYNRKGKEVARTLVDLDDIEDVKKHKWGFSQGVVASRIKGKLILLHRFLLKPSGNKEVDHIFHNRLDNRKSQLRICTRNQNNMNKKNKGFCWCKRINKWVVRIQIYKKTKYLGSFNTEKEAKEVRKQAEIKYFKEFRYIEG